MKKYIYVFILLLFITQFSCGQAPNTTQLNYDHSKIAIIPFSGKNNFETQFKNAEPAFLTQPELDLLDKILQKTIAEYNTTDAYRGIINLKEYKRQYMVIKNDQGEKKVWVNCFCDTLNEYWKKQLVIVMDGGKCYFNLKVNLSTEKAYELVVNGEA